MTRLAALCLALAIAPSAHAQTIYPLNRAEILAGSRFDLKVEFPGAPAQGAVRVTINGKDAAEATGKPAAFVGARGWRRALGLLDPRSLADGAGQLRRRGNGRRQDRAGELGGVRHGNSQGQERDPVHRRWPLGRASHRRAHPVEGDRRGPLWRATRHRRHAQHGADLDFGHGLGRHRLGEQRIGLHHRSQVLRQRAGRLLLAQQEQSRSSARGDDLRARQAHPRHVGRRRHQHRDRGCDARRDGRAQSPARRLQQHREELLCRPARRDHGRRHAELPAERRRRLEADR